ncbi:MAG TPA: hypothetical protein DCG69_04655 [Bacteroidales bacterium]|nr:hypothetical protein [Bacteroidales bacterium]
MPPKQSNKQHIVNNSVVFKKYKTAFLICFFSDLEMMNCIFSTAGFVVTKNLNFTFFIKHETVETKQIALSTKLGYFGEFNYRFIR